MDNDLIRHTDIFQYQTHSIQLHTMQSSNFVQMISFVKICYFL